MQLVTFPFLAAFVIMLFLHWIFNIGIGFFQFFAILVPVVVIEILFFILEKKEIDKTEWVEEIGRKKIFENQIERNWCFPPDDPLHYETTPVYAYDEVTLILHLKDGNQSYIKVKDEGSPDDMYHYFLPKIRETFSEDDEDDAEDFSFSSAVAEAKDYLSASPFSYKGLTEQLESDGFSPESAKYGADNCGADWEIQAVKSAEDCLETDIFSYNSLKEQLTDEEYFTPEEAEYGVQNCGADWGEQAVRYIKEYFDPKEDSKEEIEDLLRDEKFTESEINYAISKTGI